MTPGEILIVKPSSLGDVVQTLPAVHFLKRTFPDARVRWLVNAEWSPLLVGNPDLAEVLPFPRAEFRGMTGTLRGAWWARALRRLRPDMALDFQGLLRSALLGRVARPRRFLGLSDAREGARWFYDGRALTVHGQHSVERYLGLAALAGADVSGEPAWPLPAGRPLPDWQPPPRYVVLHPYARGPGKSLTDLEVSAVAAELAPWPVVVAGVASAAPALPRNAVSLVNKTTLPELIHLLRHAAFTVSVDSGPMHLAAALSDRLLALHFWSDPRKVGPFRPDAWVWRAGDFCQVRNLATVPPSPAAPSLRPEPRALARFLHDRLLRVSDAPLT